MELNYLREFTEVAEKLNFSQAADVLFTSQSTLSKHIASMENELEVKLFHRSTRYVSLTKAGELLLPAAKGITMAYTDFQQRLFHYKESTKTSVSISAIPILPEYGILDMICEFQLAHPEIELNITEGEDSLMALKELPYSEFAIIRFYGEVPEQYDYVELCRDSFVAVLPSGHPMAGQETVHLASLKKETFIFIDKDSSTEVSCRELCRSVGFNPKIKHKGYRPEAIVGLVSKGLGVSLLMQKHAEFSNNAGVTIRKVYPTTESRICLVWKKNYPLSPAASAFIRFVRESVQ